MILQVWSYERLAAIGLLLYLVNVPLDARAELPEPITCKLAFDVTAEVAHGSVNPGDQLRGSIEFSTGEVWQANEARSFKARGKMVVSHPDHGAVSGDVWVVHVSRTPYFVDYISIDARDARGDLGGVELYFDPMLSPSTPTAADWRTLSYQGNRKDGTP